MANKALEILRKAEHDLDVEIKMWKTQGRPEVVSRCKIEKAQVKQAIEKLYNGENSNDELPSEEDVREPIQGALYATGRFLTDECTELSDGILDYLNDYGFKVVKK